VPQEVKLLERQNVQLQESLTRTSAAADRSATRAREAEERVHALAMSIVPGHASQGASITVPLHTYAPVSHVTRLAVETHGTHHRPLGCHDVLFSLSIVERRIDTYLTACA
jgi:hypothetical protein